MTILVTGATGSVGRLVVDHLLASGAKQVRALTNNPKKAALPAEVQVIEGYLGRTETLPAALEGVERLYLICPMGRQTYGRVLLEQRQSIREFREYPRICCSLRIRRIV